MRSAHLALHLYAATQVKMQSAFNKCILHAVKADFNEILRLLLFRLLSTGQILTYDHTMQIPCQPQCVL